MSRQHLSTPTGAAHRSRRAQQPPPPDLSTFPVAKVRTPSSWYREHAARDEKDGGCWYFSGYPPGEEPQGRFDLPLPQGTCYLAETADAAARERCGRFTSAGAPIPTGHYQGRVISEVSAPAGAHRIADATHEDAAHHHRVTRELFSCPDYFLTTQWAHAFYTTGFDAMLYEPRFGPGPGRAIALFGTAGPDPNRAVLSSTPLGSTLQTMGLLASIPSVSEILLDEAEAEPC